ncbi:TetR/AcrR family transcriptional regulator [Aquimarina sp. 2201CG5-10]|uniref:TetR/AcrR family transcriptional regulator n=1 Tax=Aquimarina callyspongiae TaxID=3098150 RepID=UPI002AB48223|nr:TetR/AcrR family transcriptional regulator [Aquimarina sp. 2201CG5-10]MDY8134769.1 TetR/AcrR family transcriptional regulator [Aquimarina sp. 2201CG5-10]
MRPVKVEDKELIEGLNKVFREKGYEGASLNELAEGAGLKKASLYHRFPEGKKEIGLAVLSYSSEWLQKNLYELLNNKEVSPEKRLDMGLSVIRELYSEGEDTCILRSLSMESGMQFFGEEIKKEMNQWIVHFTNLGLDFGFDKEEATKKAIEVLVKIQGSLVITNAMSDNSIFISTIGQIKDLYIK